MPERLSGEVASGLKRRRVAGHDRILQMRAEPAEGLGKRGATSASGLWFWGALLAVALLPWVLPIGSGFWLDETFTYWTTRGGFSDIPRRCTEWPHSILYSGIIRTLDLGGGHDEVYLRLPSLVAMLLTALLVYRIAREMFDEETARTALVIFAGMPPVAYAADARPYALGLAAVTGAGWLLLRFGRSGRLSHGLEYGCAAALVPHLHMLFSVALPAQGFYLAHAWRKGWIRTGPLMAAGAAAALAAAPPSAAVLVRIPDTDGAFLRHRGDPAGPRGGGGAAVAHGEPHSGVDPRASQPAAGGLPAACRGRRTPAAVVIVGAAAAGNIVVRVAGGREPALPGAVLPFGRTGAGPAVGPAVAGG
ncbi:MAG: glycosyltransferase family 39 protein [Bryobacterales bacterium]|nr:glycosyltransferase family 39 protein [Bryobacterales bacterium]